MAQTLAYSLGFVNHRQEKSRQEFRNLLKKMLGKVKDTEVLDFLSDLLKYLNEQISLSEHDNS